jgi:sialate O-acetylesterase
MRSCYWIVLLLLTLQAVSAHGQDNVNSRQVTRIACIGNSVTFGFKLKNPRQESYPARLEALLGESYQVRNFGLSGATLLSKGHKPYIKSPEFSEAVNYQPDIVIFDLGLNDTDPRNWPNFSDDFITDYQKLVGCFKTKAGQSPRIYICLMTPIFYGHPRFKSGTRDWFRQIQENIKQVAQNTGATLIDLHAPLYKRPDLFSDYLHPDAEGAEIIARTVYSSVTGDYGGFRLAPIFGEHMVFQQNKPVVIYGVSDSRDKIEVYLHAQYAETAPGSDGKWRITIPPVKAGGPYILQIKVNGILKVDWNDIMSGEVWFCSGQSNMEFELKLSENGKSAAEKATDNGLRFFNYKGFISTNNIEFDSISLKRINDLSYFEGSWQTCSPGTASEFSAIGYYFGNSLRQKLDVPVGLIQVAVGGAPIEAFTDRKSLEFNPVLVDEFYNKGSNDLIFDWVRQRISKNNTLSRNPLQRHPYDPAYIFEAGIEPLGSFPVQGVIWYQGESNAHYTELYTIAFREFINSWRKFWHSLDLPVFFAQLSSIDRPSWPHFRDIQRQLADSVPNTALVVTSDLGDSLNVHPVQKKQVGERFALQALNKVYGLKVKSDGPIPVKINKTPGSLIITFKSTRKLNTSDGKPINELEIAGHDAIFRPVSAKLKRNRIIIMEPGNSIKAVRYGWKPFSHGNLVNEAELPASTFLKKVN